MLMYLMIGVGVLFGIIVIAYIILQKNNKDRKYIAQLQQGTIVAIIHPTICL